MLCSLNITYPIESPLQTLLDAYCSLFCTPHHLFCIKKENLSEYSKKTGIFGSVTFKTMWTILQSYPAAWCLMINKWDFSVSYATPISNYWHQQKPIMLDRGLHIFLAFLNVSFIWNADLNMQEAATDQSFLGCNLSWLLVMTIYSISYVKCSHRFNRHKIQWLSETSIPT